jgi:predicted transcriptional regulator
VSGDRVAVLHQLQAARRSRESCYIHNMVEKKAVLNVTVDESLAEQVRRAAKLDHTTISSVVERALRQQLTWELKRLDGIRAIEEYFEEHGYPTPEEDARAAARVAEEHRLLDEARAVMAARDRAHHADGGDVA